MAESSPGKGKARERKKTPSSKKTGAGGRAGVKSKKPSSKKKKKPRRQKETFLARNRSYLLGLSLGLLIGCLGAVAVVYFPDTLRQVLRQGLSRIEGTAPKPAGAPAPKRVAGKSKPASSGASIRPPAYEENHRLENQVKKLDLAIYHAFQEMGVPEDHVYFLNVKAKRLGKKEWEHALIEAELPPSISLKKMYDGLESAVTSRSVTKMTATKIKRRCRGKNLLRRLAHPYRSASRQGGGFSPAGQGRAQSGPEQTGAKDKTQGRHQSRRTEASSGHRH